MQGFKTKLIIYCAKYLQQKVNTLQVALKDVTDAGNNETKSTAGDKHETGRAMMQLEQEKLGKQLHEADIQLNEFNKIDFSNSPTTVSLGSLIETDKGLFFIATSIGKIELDKKSVFAISTKSPLGAAFLGKQKNECVVFNSIPYQFIALH